MSINDYKDLTVWQEAMKLCEQIYRATETFPDSERYGLTSQMCRAAVSIPSNIAEGYGRGTRQEYIRFLRVARGSAAELETQLLLARRLYDVDDEVASHVADQLKSVMRLMQALLNALSK